jgi:clan AA aspartic protease
VIRGSVSAALEPIIPLLILDGNNQWVTLDATVDTAFDEFLTLPLAVVGSLGLSWAGTRQFTLADGSVAGCDVDVATVEWDGQMASGFVLALGDDALVGMKLLSGFKLQIEVKPGGEVIIEALP